MENIKSFGPQKRIQFLLHAGEVLNTSLDYHKNLADLALLMTPNLADWCAVDMLDDKGDLQRLAVSHVDPEKIGVSAIYTEEGVYTLSSIVDISERRKIEKRIEASLREKEVLLKEIHHRVKNNLQIISSLLNLQSSFVGDGKIITVLTESQNRIRSMALIHEKLYQTMDLSKINFKEYTEELAGNLFNSYASNSRILREFDIDEIYLNVDLAIALGLIINELVTNSFKYAFPGREGIISISMKRIDHNQVQMLVKDNGSGLPENFNIRDVNTLGLQLVLSLIEQIEGTIHTASDRGAEFKITFPEN